MSGLWYYRQQEQMMGPVTIDELRERCRTNHLTLDDLVGQGVPAEWKPAREWPELGLLPPKIISAPNASTIDPIRATHPAEYVGYFLSRVVRSDFSTIAASEAERQELDQAREPITLGLAQDYVAWRRSVLAVAAVLLAIQACYGWQLHPWAYAELSGWSYLVYLGFKSILLASQWVGTVLVAFAALAWSRFRYSVMAARAAWLLMFLLPMVLFLIPLERLMGLQHEQRLIIASAFAGSCFQWLVPKILGLIPGLIRCAMTLKSLLPESAMLGWVILIIAPVYCFMLIAVLAVSIHSAQTFLTPFAFTFLLLGPLTYILHYRTLVRSHAELEGQRLIRRIRLTSVSFTLLGIVLLLLKINDLIQAQELWRPTFWNLLHLFSGVIANVLLLTVVGADFILAVIRRTHDSQQSFQGSEMQAALVRKFTVLTNVGLSDWLGDDQPTAIISPETTSTTNT